MFGPLTHYATQSAAWELFKSHFKALQAKAGESQSSSSAQVTECFCEEKLRDDSQQFFAAQKLPGTERILENGRDIVNACIEVRSLQQAKLSAHLTSASAMDANK